MLVRSIETQLVLQCAPFLAGLKVSNLLAIPADMENAAMDMLKKAGISFFRMIKTDKKTVILLFHRKQLESYLYKEDVKEILISEGYMEFQIGYVLYMFSIRYQDYICGKGKFPHEIGLILGYPAEDVRGFMVGIGGMDVVILAVGVCQMVSQPIVSPSPGLIRYIHKRKLIGFRPGTGSI